MNKNILLFLTFLSCTPIRATGLVEKLAADALISVIAWHTSHGYKPKGADANLLALIFHEAALKKFFPQFASESVAQTIKFFSKKSDLGALKKYSESHFLVWSSLASLYSAGTKLSDEKEFIQANMSYFLPVAAIGLAKAAGQKLLLNAFIEKYIVDNLVGAETAENAVMRKTLISTFAYVSAEYGLEALFMWFCAYIYQGYAENNFDISSANDVKQLIKHRDTTEKATELTSKVTKGFFGLCHAGYKLF